MLFAIAMEILSLDIRFSTINALRADYGIQFEILVAHLYCSLARPGDVVIDGGANSGLHTLPLATVVGEWGLVYAFEPNPEVHRQLVLNSANYPWVRCERKALMETDVAEVRFLVHQDNPGLSQLGFVLGHQQSTEHMKEIVVQGVALDNSIDRRPVSLIKLDLEGAEFLCLKGARHILLQDRPIVIFENGRAWNGEQYGYSSEEFFESFTAWGYALYDIHAQPLTPSNWTSDDIGFEFVAVPVADPRLAGVLQLCRTFWETLPQRPVLTEWMDCIRSVRNLTGYFGQ